MIHRACIHVYLYTTINVTHGKIRAIGTREIYIFVDSSENCAYLSAY